MIYEGFGKSFMLVWPYLGESFKTLSHLFYIWVNMVVLTPMNTSVLVYQSIGLQHTLVNSPLWKPFKVSDSIHHHRLLEREHYLHYKYLHQQKIVNKFISWIPEYLLLPEYLSCSLNSVQCRRGYALGIPKIKSEEERLLQTKDGIKVNLPYFIVTLGNEMSL